MSELKDRNFRNPQSNILDTKLGSFLVKKAVTVDANAATESASIEPKTVMVKCKCRSQYCVDCMPGLMVKLRERWRPALAKWKKVQMITLTVDPERFATAEECYKHVQEKRLVAETVRSLHKRGLIRSRQFAYVIEFHKNGFPHWHLLVDSNWTDHEKLKRTWKVGHVWLSPTNKFQSNDHAINYVTKYVSKIEQAFPDWVLDYSGNLRRFSTSRGLCPSEKKPRKPKVSKVKRKRVRRTPRERVSSCGSDTAVYQVDQEKWKFIETLGIEFAAVQDLTLTEAKALVSSRSAESRSSLAAMEVQSRESLREFFRCPPKQLPDVVRWIQDGGTLAGFLERNRDRCDESYRSRVIAETLLFAAGGYRWLADDQELIPEPDQ